MTDPKDTLDKIERGEVPTIYEEIIERPSVVERARELLRGISPHDSANIPAFTVWIEGALLTALIAEVERLEREKTMCAADLVIDPLVKKLKGEIERLEDDRQKYLENWNRSLIEIESADAIFDFHPRATKLMGKRKPFIVVACDEPYFCAVYCTIKEHEQRLGRWFEEDDKHYIASCSGYADRSLLQLRARVETLEGHLKEMATAKYQTFTIDLNYQTGALAATEYFNQLAKEALEDK